MRAKQVRRSFLTRRLLMNPSGIGGGRMSRLQLTSWQRRRLRRQLAETRDARLYRRTLAVLEYDRGRPAAEVARMLGVARQSVHIWVEATRKARQPSTRVYAARQ